MKVLGIRKSLLIPFIILAPLGFGMIYVKLKGDPNYSVMLSLDKGSAVVGDCLEAPGFDDYLEQLNKANKAKNIACAFSGTLTTMAKGIECGVPNGPTMAYFYWAENLSECQRVKETIKK